jgi:2Fe-2S ferredoxin
MATITYIEFDGTTHIVDVPAGVSVMQGAKNNGIPGIDADCGGGCSCGTCHVLVDPAWLARVGGRTPIETGTIEFVEDVQPNSRLSCQIKISDALDGLIVRMPESQR